MKNFKQLLVKLVFLSMVFSLFFCAPVQAATKKVTVTTQKQLTAALANDSITSITIKTSKAIKFTIPTGDYNDTRLYLKAPNAKITNKGDFKSVHAYVSNQTYLNVALKDNTITVITIVTDSTRSFTISGDHSDITLIVDAPNATVNVSNAELKKVTVTEAKEVVTPTPVVKDEKKEEVVTPEVTVTPEPTKAPEVTEAPVAGGGMGGGGFFPPSFPSAPSVPVVPSAPVVETPSVPTPTPVVTVTPEPTATPTPVVTETPSEPVDTLKALKEEKISALKVVIDAKVALIPISKTELLAEIKQTTDSLYANIMTKTTESEVTELFNTDYAYVTRPDIFVYIMTNEERQEMESTDYASFKAGSMPITQLYSKYANNTTGYLSAINVMDYTYAVVDGVTTSYKDSDLIAESTDNIVGQISYYDNGTSFYYIDYKNNCTYMFLYDASYYESINFSKNDYFNELIGLIVDGTYVDYGDKVDGCIVSFNTIGNGVEVKDLTKLNTSTIITGLSPLTIWTNESGKQYYSRQGYLPSQQTIVAESTDGLGMVNVVTGSAITYSFKLYMNDCSGVSTVGVYNPVTLSYDPINSDYYTISPIDPFTNTATITFTTDFAQNYLTGKNNGEKFTFIMFPSNYLDNGSGLNFYIKY